MSAARLIRCTAMPAPRQTSAWKGAPSGAGRKRAARRRHLKGWEGVVKKVTNCEPA